MFSKEWRFAVLSNGLVEDVANGKCLSVPGAASNASVSLADCDVTKPGQRWSFTH
jgi:hypothetical protein